MSIIDRVQALALLAAMALVIVGIGLHMRYSRRTAPVENVVPLRGRRLHVIRDGLGEVGQQADRAWPAPATYAGEQRRDAAREMATHDGLGSEAA
jgi:hypothetical protein